MSFWIFTRKIWVYGLNTSSVSVTQALETWLKLTHFMSLHVSLRHRFLCYCKGLMLSLSFQGYFYIIVTIVSRYVLNIYNMLNILLFLEWKLWPDKLPVLRNLRVGKIFLKFLEFLCRIFIISSISVWQNSPIKLSGPEVFLKVRFLSAISISLIDKVTFFKEYGHFI